MLYTLHYIGGPRDGAAVFSPRPYESIRENDGAVYAAKESGEACLEWAGDDERNISLHYAGKMTREEWMQTVKEPK